MVLIRHAVWARFWPGCGAVGFGGLGSELLYSVRLYLPGSLFYEPSNWLPFIAYFVVGAVCGYVQLRNSEPLGRSAIKTSSCATAIRSLTQLYHDAIEDKRAYRRQIVGRHDSFGKIFAVTQELDVLNPRDIYRKRASFWARSSRTIRWRSTMFRAEHLHAWWQQVPRLPKMPHACSRLSSLHLFLGDGGRSNLWVNRELTPGFPCLIHDRARRAPAVLIFVRSAAENQMTLYYQNLFRILCGLVESALGRAFDYEAVAQDKRCVDGTCVLKQAAFLAKSSRRSRRSQIARWGVFCSCAWYRAWSLSTSWWAQLVGNPRERRGGLGRRRRALTCLCASKGVRSAHYPRAPECKADCGGARRRRGHRGAAAAHR